MTTAFVRFLSLLFLTFIALPADAQFLRPHEPFDSSKAQSLPFTPGEIVVLGEDGQETHSFQFEVAGTDPTRSIGLMHRAEIFKDRGMLFDFKRDRKVGMWMRNTFIPLDMLFLSSDGTVVTIAKNTVPHSEKTVSSRVRVRSVLELKVGTVARLGIKTGDSVKHAIFENYD